MTGAFILSKQITIAHRKLFLAMAGLRALIYGTWVFWYVLPSSVAAYELLSPFELWDMIQGKELFHQVYDSQGHYSAKSHLAEMIALLDPPRREFVAKAESMPCQKWPDPVKGEEGKTFTSAREYFGGPFFDSDGL